MSLHIPAKVLIHVWSYDFYDMSLSTGKQLCHMINVHNGTFFVKSTSVCIYSYRFVRSTLE